MADRVEKRYGKTKDDADPDLQPTKDQREGKDPNVKPNPEKQYGDPGKDINPNEGGPLGGDYMKEMLSRQQTERAQNIDRHDRERSEMNRRHEKDFKDLNTRHTAELSGPSEETP